LGSLAKYSTITIAVIVNLILYGSLAILLRKIFIRLAARGFTVNLLYLSIIPYIVMVGIGAVLLQLNELLAGSSELQYAFIFLLLPHVVFGRILYYLFRQEHNTLQKSARTKNSTSAMTPTTTTATTKTTPNIPTISPRTDTEATKTSSSPSQNARKVTRRQFIIMGVSSFVTILFLYLARGLIFNNPQSAYNSKSPSTISRVPIPPLNVPPNSIFRETALAPFISSEVTPNEKFYRVDTNIFVPSVDANSWRLKVHGLVKNGPLEFTYQQIKSMSSITEYATLECISDEISGDLISTALWRGVRLKSILEEAGIMPEAIFIVFRCYDGYDVGIPLEKGLLEGTILAYEMNGAALPNEHGFPLRVIVPGLYGMMNAKWITEIELVDKVYEGFWQRKGWTNSAKYKTHSKIVFPGDALATRFEKLASISSSTAMSVGTKSPIVGIAFAGDRGISKVEVSTDGGNTWQPATIKDPISSNSWVLWALDWIPKNKGDYDIVVRATDKTGNVQTPEFADNFPSGSTGYHIVKITVI
jgi:DMSO/TMAO reductase YedYZ molybdopterin-dependent catalytic subunit